MSDYILLIGLGNAIKNIVNITRLVSYRLRKTSKSKNFKLLGVKPLLIMLHRNEYNIVVQCST